VQPREGRIDDSCQEAYRRTDFYDPLEGPTRGKEPNKRRESTGPAGDSSIGRDQMEGQVPSCWGYRVQNSITVGLDEPKEINPVSRVQEVDDVPESFARTTIGIVHQEVQDNDRALRGFLRCAGLLSTPHKEPP